MTLPIEDPLWYKDAIIYELHVRAFYDSNDDGMGDFAGLTKKLDYLQELGVTALWILPFNPSPWRDDGYDISDYTNIHPAYGNLADFKTFLDEAHKRRLRVITEVVINHTSDQHPWFQRARTSPPDSEFRNYYVWSDTPEKYKDARIIFKDYEPSNWTWDPVAKAYYWHRFFSHQPDLNFDNPAVRQAVLDVIDFWFDMGVDAFRLDAIPYLYERADTNCENLPETHDFLKEVRRHVDEKYPNRMLLAEANQWPEDAIAYFGNGDECHMAFHFPLMPRLFMANRMEDSYPIIEILQQTPPIPESSQWALFLRNHDELTLEMVTDEERDYMYRTYASDRQMRVNLGIRRRLAPLLGNDRRKIELMNALLFSLPGTPVIYYGDEIGMGDNIYLGDRNGVRTPMQWSSDRNAGFSAASPQKLYLPITFDPEYHYETINVATQQQNVNSLLWWMKRLIEVRKKFKAFGRGTIEFLTTSNRKILAFLRRFGEETILVLVNLSRHPQHATLDLPNWREYIPVELFGGSEFPPIGDTPYFVTLGGYSFFWLSLTHRPAARESTVPAMTFASAPLISIGSWSDLGNPDTIAGLMRFLPRFIETRRWYKGLGRRIRATSVQDLIQVSNSSYIVLAQIDYTDGDPDTYLLPMAVAIGEAQIQSAMQHADTGFARVRTQSGEEGVLYGALWDPEFSNSLVAAMVEGKTMPGRQGNLLARRSRWFDDRMLTQTEGIIPAPSAAEQSNSSILFGERMILKIFRKLEPGVNPDAEMSTFLLDHGFPNTPALLGEFEYRARGGDVMTTAILQEYIPNQGDAWKLTRDALRRYYELAMARTDWEQLMRLSEGDAMQLSAVNAPAEVRELLETYTDMALLLGERTAQMHLAATDLTAPAAFRPEPFADDYRQGLYYGMLAGLNRTLELLRQRMPSLPSDAKALASELLTQADRIRHRLRYLRETRIHAMRIRTHGTFHLAQVLYTGKDFVVIDFEGDPSRPIGERRIKRSALRDVASMLRSLDYAAYTHAFGSSESAATLPEGSSKLESAATFWTKWAGAAFLKGYLGKAEGAAFLPADPGQLRIVLDSYLIDTATTELAHILQNKPDLAGIPLRALARFVQ